MIRRSSVVALLAASALPALGAQAADPVPAPELPRATCSKRWTDPEGDAYSNPTGNATFNQIKASGLDIIGSYLRTTPTEIQMFVKIKDIPTPTDMPPHDLSYRYTMGFKHSTQAFSMATVQVNPDHANLMTGPVYPNIDPAVSGVRGSVDPATDWVYLAVSRESIAKKAAETPVVDGELLEGITFKSEYLIQNSRPVVADQIAPAGDAAKFTIGDDSCFGPPPAALSEVTATAAQFGDATTVKAKLVDEAGAALADQQVNFTLGASSVTGTTNAEGFATAVLPVTVPAGTHAVAATYAGTEAIGKAKADGSVLVRSEVTKFAALAVKKTSTTARTVTATLKDDDGKAVSGQKVAWYVNGKLASTVVTDSAGRSVYRAAKAGQSVQARYAGLSGKYVAAKSNIAKV